MSIRAIASAVCLFMLLTSACGADHTESAESAAGERVARLDRMVDVDPALLLARVRHAYDRTTLRAGITFSYPDSGERPPFVFVATKDAWRVDQQPVPASDGGDAGDGWASVLASDDEICMDREFRPMLASYMELSNGLIDFDPDPWTCSALDFGVTTMATAPMRTTDPRWRIESLVTDDPVGYTAEVDEAGDEPLLHIRTTGVTSAGALDPERPIYDLWIDSDHLPVRMESEFVTWTFDYPEGLEDELTPPSTDERGSYGYWFGFGQAAAKACYLAPQACDRWEHARPDLTWSDGRRS